MIKAWDAGGAMCRSPSLVLPRDRDIDHPNLRYLTFQVQQMAPIIPQNGAPVVGLSWTASEHAGRCSYTNG
jgi:hypothetical protein